MSAVRTETSSPRPEISIAAWAKDTIQTLEANSLLQSGQHNLTQKEQLKPDVHLQEKSKESTKEQSKKQDLEHFTPKNNKTVQEEKSAQEEDEGCSPPTLTNVVAIPILNEGEIVILTAGCQEDIPSKLLQFEVNSHVRDEENKKLESRVAAKEATIDLLQRKINELEKKKNDEINQLKRQNQSLGDRIKNVLKTSNSNEKKKNLPVNSKSSLNNNNEMNRLIKNNQDMENQLRTLRNQSSMDALRHAEHLLRTEPWRLHQRLKSMNNYFHGVLDKERRMRSSEVSSLNNQLQATKEALYASVEKSKKRGRQDQGQDNLNTSYAPQNKRIKLERQDYKIDYNMNIKSGK